MDWTGKYLQLDTKIGGPGSSVVLVHCAAVILVLYWTYLLGWVAYSDWLRAGRSGDRIPVGGEIFRTCPDRPWGSPSLLYNGYRVFPGGKERSGRDTDPSPLLVPLVIKEYSYISTPPTGRTACTEPQCLYKGALYLYLLHKNSILSTFLHGRMFVPGGKHSKHHCGKITK